MNFQEWLDYGLENGFCGPTVCLTHDGYPTTEEEDLDDEPCIFVIRYYTDPEHRAAVEANHAPSVWRR